MAKQRSRITNQKKDYLIGNHVVAVLDVLGQQQKLQGWARLPEVLPLTTDYVKALKQTVGTVISFQEGFENFFCEFAAAERSQSLVGVLTPQQQAAAHRFKRCDLKRQQFADTFVFYAPIRNSAGDTSVIPLYGLLSACCMAMLFSLAAGVPVRGALAVGTGVEICKNNFYGPALAEAHHFENKVAEYPRIVVSDSTLAFSSMKKGFSDDEMVEKLMATLADVCRSFLCRDTDGMMIVDFLGAGMRTLTEPPEQEVLRGVAKGYEFVCSEWKRFRDARDPKHALRYYRLKEYMESRLSNWLGEKGD